MQLVQSLYGAVPLIYWGALLDQLVVFCQFLLVIALHDQWVYPSLSHSPVKMDLDDDDDDVL